MWITPTSVLDPARESEFLIGGSDLGDRVGVGTCLALPGDMTRSHPRSFSPLDLHRKLADEISGILGFAELIQLDDEFHRERTEEIIQSSQRAFALLDEFGLGVRMLETPASCALNIQVETVATTLERLLARRVEVKTRLDPRVGVVPMGAHEIEAMLFHLCSAAVHAQAETIVIRTELAPAIGPDNFCRLIVEDEGRPVEPHDLRWILNGKDVSPADNPLASLISRMRRLGGTVQLESIGRSTTRVTFEFPVARESGPLG